MSDYLDENKCGDLILIVRQDGRDFGIPIGTIGGGMDTGSVNAGIVTAVDGIFCTAMMNSGVSLQCDVFYDGPCLGDRVAVFTDRGRRYAMIGLRNKATTE